MTRPHLRDVPVTRLDASLAAAGFENPAGKARTIGLASHRDNAVTPDEIPVGRPVKALLAERFAFDPLLTPVAMKDGGDGATRKWMFRLRSGESVEAVLIRHWDDHTLCVS